MEINEFLKYRTELLEDCKDEEGYVSESAFLETILPSLNDAKLVDSESYEDCYFLLQKDNLKINGYQINESGERLQLFMINEDSIDIMASDEVLSVSQKAVYDSQFNRIFRFINKSIKNHLDDEVQDSHPVKALISFISSSLQGMEQIDVIEIFLISASATVEKRGSIPQPKRIDFEDETISVNYQNKEKKTIKKEIQVYKRLIDLNFLHSVLISQGNRELLEVNFTDVFGRGIDAIQAADEVNFESYLCVLPASMLAELYKRYSSRMLEKNVRSFLQFKGVNQGIRDTIRKEPEHFIAYNNGLTITAVGGDIQKNNGKVVINTLTDFQIVNGGQTTATIYFSKKDGFDISKIRVMAKINVAKNADEEKLNDLISNISRFSNAQSKVSTADLRSRNEQLIKLKSVSESTPTPSGRKWFFERFKGEFNTLLRKNPNGKTKINNEYPKERRFTKEELAKYFMSWGDQPYLVKKGGEKIFRQFIDVISPNENSKGIIVTRDFFEEVVARIILFKSLEKTYGAGKNAIGQLRSAVIPYTMGVLYVNTNGSKGSASFDLAKIWQLEGLDEALIQMLNELMILTNDLIKKYSPSEDYGEFSKRKELWDAITQSNEMKQFVSSELFQDGISKFKITKEELKKREQKRNKIQEIDFSNLYDNARIYALSSAYYQKLGLLIADNISVSQRAKIDHIINCIINKNDISEAHCYFEKELINHVRSENPEIFEKINYEEKSHWIDNLNEIVNIYNHCLKEGKDIRSAFQKERELVKLKGGKFYAIYDEIGKALEQGKLPSMKNIGNINRIN